MSARGQQSGAACGSGRFQPSPPHPGCRPHTHLLLAALLAHRRPLVPVLLLLRRLRRGALLVLVEQHPPVAQALLNLDNLQLKAGAHLQGGHKGGIDFSPGPTAARAQEPCWLKSAWSLPPCPTNKFHQQNKTSQLDRPLTS